MSRFVIYSPTHVDFRQLHRTIDGNPISENGQMIQCNLYFYVDGSGYAMETRYYEKEINFYRFGCEHNYVELNVSHYYRCMHTYKCNVCQHTYTVDSSD